LKRKDTKDAKLFLDSFSERKREKDKQRIKINWDRIKSKNLVFTFGFDKLIPQINLNKSLTINWSLKENKSISRERRIMGCTTSKSSNNSREKPAEQTNSEATKTEKKPNARWV